MKTTKKAKKEASKKEVKKSKKEKKVAKTRASKDGKFKSVRHLMETLFAKNKNMEKEVADKMVAKEFPDSAWAKNLKKKDSIGSHFPWYKNHIVSHREFTTIDVPAWAKGGAKIKK